MLVYESAQPKNGSSWYDAFASRLPSVASRRLAAMQLAWPGESVDMPNASRPSYNALAAFWGDDTDRLKKLAAALVALKEAADQNIGQNVAIFTQGSPESLTKGTGNLISPVTMLIGVVARSGYGIEPEGSLEYKYASRQVNSEEDKSSPRPSLSLAVGVDIQAGVQTLSVEKFGTSSVTVSDTAPDGTSSIDILRGQVTFNEDREVYEAFRRLTEVPLLVGNAAVSEYVARLTIYDNGDARHNWRELNPATNQPLPELSQIFGEAA